YRIRHRNSVAVENSPLNGDALAGDTFANQVVAVQPMETNLEIRPNRLRRGRLQTHLFLHRGGFAPPQDEIETVTQRVFWHGSFPVEQRDQSVAGFFIRRAVEDRVKRNQRITGKGPLRHQAPGKRGTEESKANVRRPPGVVVIAPGILARPNRAEAIAALGVADGLSAPG